MTANVVRHIPESGKIIFDGVPDEGVISFGSHDEVMLVLAEQPKILTAAIAPIKN